MGTPYHQEKESPFVAAFLFGMTILGIGALVVGIGSQQKDAYEYSLRGTASASTTTSTQTPQTDPSMADKAKDWLKNHDVKIVIEPKK